MSANEKTRVVGRPPKEDDGDARNRILEGAIAAFAETGIAASTIKGISLKAGCTPALIHYHFTDKETLVIEALESFVIPVIKRFWNVVELDLEPAEMLLEIVRRVLATAQKTPWFLSIWSRELANEGGVLRDFLRARISRDWMRLFRDKVIAGQRDGSVNPDIAPELAYVSLISTACFPALTRPGWGRLFDRVVDDKSLERHVMGLVSRGFTNKKERDSHDPRKLGNRHQGGRLQGGRGRKPRRRSAIRPGRHAS